ncbi:hypothetical protein D3C72_1133480 [compost metagenome]
MSEFTEWRDGVRGSKPHRCEFCYRTIPARAPHSVVSGRFDGAWFRQRYHGPCDRALAEARRADSLGYVDPHGWDDWERVKAFAAAGVLEEALAYFRPARDNDRAWQAIADQPTAPAAMRELAQERARAKVHRLKTWPAYFEAVVDGRKPFELRRDDRDFQVGDVLHLYEFDPEANRHTGRKHRAAVGYLIRGPQFGIEAGWVALGLAPVLEAIAPRGASDSA